MFHAVAEIYADGISAAELFPEFRSHVHQILRMTFRRETEKLVPDFCTCRIIAFERIFQCGMRQENRLDAFCLQVFLKRSLRRRLFFSIRMTSDRPENGVRLPLAS